MNCSGCGNLICVIVPSCLITNTIITEYNLKFEKPYDCPKLLEKGIFISIEGGDGCGKTTQINLLKEYFSEKDRNVIITREPGGTLISEKIREIILDIDNSEMTDRTEALLYAASRAQHTEQVILPNLLNGNVVISDRYVDSSIVYQGHARGLGIKNVKDINNFATRNLLPDLTIYLYLPQDIGIERKKNQKDLDRMESAKEEFHAKVYEGFNNLADMESERIFKIDASNSIVNIQNEIRTIIEKRLCIN